MGLVKRARKKRRKPKTPIDQVDLDKQHWTYLLYSDKHRQCYVGYTRRPHLRLGQHRSNNTRANKTTRWQDPNCRFLCVVTGFLNVRDGQQFEWLFSRYSTSPKKLCEFVDLALKYGKLKKTTGRRSPTRTDALGKPWTRAAKAVSDPLRQQKGPFRVYWFSHLPDGFVIPESSAHVQHRRVSSTHALA